METESLPLKPQDVEEQPLEKEPKLNKKAVLRKCLREAGLYAFVFVVTLLLFILLKPRLKTQYPGTVAQSFIAIGLAAVIIGEALFGRIFRNFGLRMLSVIFGGIVYYIVYQTVILFGLDPDLLKMLSALVVAVFLAVPYWKNKWFTKPVKKGGADHA